MKNSSVIEHDMHISGDHLCGAISSGFLHLIIPWFESLLKNTNCFKSEIGHALDNDFVKLLYLLPLIMLVNRSNKRLSTYLHAVLMKD